MLCFRKLIPKKVCQYPLWSPTNVTITSSKNLKFFWKGCFSKFEKNSSCSTLSKHLIYTSARDQTPVWITIEYYTLLQTSDFLLRPPAYRFSWKWCFSFSNNNTLFMSNFWGVPIQFWKTVRASMQADENHIHSLNPSVWDTDNKNVHNDIHTQLHIWFTKRESSGIKLHSGTRNSNSTKECWGCASCISSQQPSRNV